MIETVELDVVSGDVLLPASLTLSAGNRARGGLVPLHPAREASREQFLFRHLAEILPPLGLAILRYDRRRGNGDVPLRVQAQDALAAIGCLVERLGSRDLPIGLWGYSQGAWAAPLAAAQSTKVAFLVLCASTGVAPAAQMRYGTARQLRRAGFGDVEVANLLKLRSAVEEYQRGRADREAVQEVIDRTADEPWFGLAWVPRVLPEPGTWVDMDFDPEPVLRRIQCPVLLFYGEDDEWQPIEESIATWQRATAVSGNNDVTIVRLPGAGHEPTLRHKNVVSASALYTQTLVSWLGQRISSLTNR